MIKLTKNQFDEIIRHKNPEVFTEAQMNSWVEGLKDTLVKAEVDELDEKEKALVDEFNAEFKSFVKVQVICSPEEKDLNKSLKYVNLFIRDKQVSFSEEDQIQKSEDGGEDKVVGKIITGTYLDTELNRELNRVGNTFTKSEETDIEKGGKVANVGEIHNWNGKKFRKEPNGKWVEVSTHKMSKKEHADMANMIETHPDQSDKDTPHYKSQLALHKKNAEKLSDKEHSDEEVGKGNKFGLEDAIVHKVGENFHVEKKEGAVNFLTVKPKGDKFIVDVTSHKTGNTLNNIKDKEFSLEELKGVFHSYGIK